jgi:hypothetical protein
MARQTDSKFKADPKTAWAGLKSLLKLNDKRSECSVNPNTLNVFFARFENDNLVIPDLPTPDPNVELFTSDMVYNIFKSLNVSKATGPDMISARLIKTLADSLAYPMCTIFNNSIKSATVPTIWKSANITPLPKFKGATEAKDYRPIALTPILAKCLEKLVAPHVTKHICDPVQYAYQQNRSTDDALLVLLDQVTNHIDKSARNYVRAIFIDFSSAFNTINSSTLISKMLEKGINENIIAWTYSFLTGRQQRVRVADELSDAITTSTGSPQGCVLSPILFTLYVENMTTSYENIHILKYADDTVILELLCQEQPSNLQQEISKLAAWCSENFLLINTSKTKEMLFTNKQHNPDPPLITINDSNVLRVEEYKYLGTTLHHKLNFSTNTSNIVKKANKRLFIVKQLAYMKVLPTTIKLAFSTFIESILRYHIVIIHGHLTAEMKKQYNHVLKTAAKLSQSQLEYEPIDSIYNTHFRRKCLRICCTAADPPVTLEQLPSGRFRIPKHRVNCRKLCFRSLCVRYINTVI